MNVTRSSARTSMSCQSRSGSSLHPQPYSITSCSIPLDWSSLTISGTSSSNCLRVSGPLTHVISRSLPRTARPGQPGPQCCGVYAKFDAGAKGWPDIKTTKVHKMGGLERFGPTTGAVNDAENLECRSFCAISNDVG